MTNVIDFKKHRKDSEIKEDIEEFRQRISTIESLSQECINAICRIISEKVKKGDFKAAHYCAYFNLKLLEVSLSVAYDNDKKFLILNMDNLSLWDRFTLIIKLITFWR